VLGPPLEPDDGERVAPGIPRRIRRLARIAQEQVWVLGPSARMRGIVTEARVPCREPALSWAQA